MAIVPSRLEIVSYEQILQNVQVLWLVNGILDNKSNFLVKTQ
jgi:hypothetical protein